MTPAIPLATNMHLTADPELGILYSDTSGRAEQLQPRPPHKVFYRDHLEARPHVSPPRTREEMTA